MSSKRSNHDKEPKVPDLTALSLSTGVGRADKTPIPSRVTIKMNRKSTSYAINGENASQETLMTGKRPRTPDGGDLTIGTEPGSGLLKLKRVNINLPVNPTMSLGAPSESELTRKSPLIVNVPANPLRVGYSSNPLHPGNGVNAYGVAGTSEGKAVNDVDKGTLYNYSIEDIEGESSSRTTSYGRGNSRTAPVLSEKIRYRMIKNRESAARSRERRLTQEALNKQENTELKAENSTLKKIVRYLLAVIRTKKMNAPDLSRCSSAPF